MKRFLVLFLFAFLGAGCLSQYAPPRPIDGEAAAVGAERYFRAMIAALDEGSCDDFALYLSPHFGERLTDEECQEAKTVSVPDGLEFVDLKSSSAPALVDVRTNEQVYVTTMLQGEDGIWRSDIKFWKNLD